MSGKGCVEGGLPFVVHIDVFYAADKETLVDFVYSSLAYEVGCEGFFFSFDKFGDFCLNVGL